MYLTIGCVSEHLEGMWSLTLICITALELFFAKQKRKISEIREKENGEGLRIDVPMLS